MKHFKKNKYVLGWDEFPYFDKSFLSANVPDK